MENIMQRLNSLSPKQRELLKFKLKEKGIDLSQIEQKKDGQSIDKVEEAEYYPASSVQKRLFLLEEIEELGVTYNMPVAIYFDNKIDIKKVEQALNQVVHNNEILRTIFCMIDGQVVQKICEYQEVQLSNEEIDKSQITAKINDFIRPFDLKKGPLIRYKLLKITQERSVLIVDMHHIISDGVSVGIFAREFVQIYKGEQLRAGQLQYKDFAVWENKNKSFMQEHEVFWKKVFNKEVEPLNLPLDFPRPSQQTFQGKTISIEVGRELTNKMHELAQEKKVTLYMILLSVYNILLYKYTGQEDILIGTPVAGRYHPSMENMLGMFVNTIVMRNYPSGSKHYIDFLDEVKENTTKSYNHQAYSLEHIINNLDIKKEKGRNMLFDTMLVWHNEEKVEVEIDGIKGRMEEITPSASKFDLTLNIKHERDTICVSVEYNTNLFLEQSVQRLCKSFINILRTVVNKPNIQLSDIGLLEEIDARKLIHDFNQTKVVFRQDVTLMELFEEQVQKNPNNIALIFGEQKVTYQELNEKANSLAYTIRRLGIGRNDSVALLVDRSIEMIVGLLGVLKSGAAYLPILKSYPLERIRYILEDSKAKLMLTDDEKVYETYPQMKVLNLNDKAIYDTCKSNLTRVCHMEDLAYIIYTSGTTGKPKGVMIEHRNISNTIQWRVKEYNSNNQHVILQLFSYVFDGFVTSFFTPIVSGGKVILLNEMEVKNPECIRHYINKYGVTHFIAVPSLYSTLLACFNSSDLKTVQVITLAGEQVTSKLVEESKKMNHSLEIVNEYGPTENSVATTILRNVEVNSHISIGRPIANTHVYILDKHYNICPIGVPGELCISGSGVARGYLNNEALTYKKFIQNPYETNERLYKTGDLVKWNNDGTIDFIARIDKQVKIRGFRIETDEIVQCLQKVAGVKQATVCAKGEENNVYLCAYVVVNTNIEEQEIRQILLQQLPDYMIPSYIIFIDKLPLTDTGKINEHLLPMPDTTKKLICESPTNSEEEMLLQLYRQVLKIDQIGINYNFFEMGGQSLKAGLLLSKIYNKTHIMLSIKDIFKYPTIKELAKYIREQRVTDEMAIKHMSKSNACNVSWAQKNIYVLAQTENVDTSYNMSNSIDIEGLVDIVRLEKALYHIIDRHEVLRTIYKVEDSQVIQVVLDQFEFKLDVVRGEGEDIEAIKRRFIRPFSLQKAPLLRACLIMLSDTHSKLLIDIHHIACDGTSIKLIIGELQELYLEHQLPSLEIQYRDYATWQNNRFNTNAWHKEKEYWENIFKTEVAKLNMPTDYARPYIQSFSGNRITYELTKDLSNKIMSLCESVQVTPYMLFLATYYLLIYKYTGQEDIVIGTPVEGRTNPSVRKLVGMFVNTIALRETLDSEISFKELLLSVKETVLSALDNQEYPFIKLIDDLKIPTTMGRNPLFDTMFSLNEMSDYQIKMGDLKISVDELDSYSAKFDFSLDINKTEDLFICELEYCTDLFSEYRMQRFLMHYSNLLHYVISNPETPIGRVEVLLQEEKERLESLNDTKVPYSDKDTVCSLFEKQVNKTPNNIALRCKDQAITYHELDKQACKIAYNLRKIGIEQGDIVGILVGRSCEMISGLLGILKTGAAYLPIDIETPNQRIEAMLNDAQSRVLLVDRNSKGKHFAIEKVYRIEEIINEELQDEYQLIDNVKSNDLMYVMYTSGSTGKPKGVQVEHKNVVGYINAFKNEFKITDRDIMLQQATCAFDTFVEEVYPILTTGGTLVVTSKEDLLSYSTLIKVIHEYGITIISCSPLLISILNEEVELGQVHTIISGGDVLKRSYISNLIEKVKIYNTYGPTETTVCATYYQCDNNQTREYIPIGKPIANYKVYILDKNNQLVARGVPGELCIGGVGVTRGYLNQNFLTKAKFIDNPFVKGEKLYKTGDLAKWNDHYEIEFLGRIDNQIKVRGYRIEIDEIEKNILSHPTISNVVVLANGEGAQKYLVAFYIASKKIDDKELRNHLQGKVPQYMIPNYIIQVDEMPLTKNGKINKERLLSISLSSESEVVYQQPTTQLEAKLLKIWKQVLNVEDIGIKHSFFEMGGNSIRAMQMIMEAQKQGIMIQLNQLMRYQTIESICNEPHIEEDKHDIDSLEMLNKGLSERFTFENKLEVYVVEKIEFTVLYSLYTNEDERNSVLEYISEKGGSKYYPNYVRNVLAEVKQTNNLSKKTFSKLMNLKCPETIESEYIFKDIMTKSNKYQEYLLQSSTYEEMAVTASQKMFLNRHSGYSGTIISFKCDIDREALSKAFYKLVGQQIFMHSILVQKGNELVWRKLDIQQGALQIPYIDLSMYGVEQQEELFRDILQKYYFYPYQILENILYRVVLIGNNEKEYWLILPFNHTIFDGMSEEILKTKLLYYYECCLSNVEIKDELPDDYVAFSQQLQRVANVVTYQELNELFELKEYYEDLSNLKVALNESSVLEDNAIDHIAVAINLESRSINDIIPINRSLEVIAKLFKNCFSINKVPIGILSYGRKYEKNSILNTIGVFVDVIPTVLNFDSATSPNEQIEKSIKLASENSINFLSLREQTSDSDIKKLLDGIYDFPITFNYLGKREKENEKNYSCLDQYREVHQIAGKATKQGMAIEVSYTEEKIYIDIEMKKNKKVKAFFEDRF